jgi:hypothetical protein
LANCPSRNSPTDFSDESMKFIDPRLPGYHIEPEVFRASQSATALLSDAMKKERGFPVKPIGSNN